MILLIIMLGLMALAFFSFIAWKYKNKKMIQVQKNEKIIHNLQKKKLKIKKLLSLLEKGKLFFLLIIFFLISFFKKLLKKKWIFIIIPSLLCAAGNNEKFENSLAYQKNLPLTNESPLDENKKNIEKLKKCQKLLKEILVENKNLIQEVEKALYDSNKILKYESRQGLSLSLGWPLVYSSSFSPFFSLSYSFKTNPLLIGISFYQNQLFIQTGYRW